jgi:ABC-type transport system involved in Fe-S cluster assembly fused permease/ATPase subunit
VKKKREVKEWDQDQAMFAANLLKELIECNQDIEGSIWIAAFMFVISTSLHGTGFSYEEFQEEINRMSAHYKMLWEQNDN